MSDFSVLMAVYDKDNAVFLEECFESIFSQSVLPTEIVVVKDGMLTAPLDEVIEKVVDCYPDRMRTIQLENNVGLGNALRIGVQSCNFELIARMDADDICVPDRFKLQLVEFERDPSLSILGGQILEFEKKVADAKNKRAVPLGNIEIRKFAQKRNPFNHMTVMFKKSTVLEAGNYVDLRLAEDYFLWIRMLSRGEKAKNLEEVLVYARAGDGMIARRGGLKYVRYMMNFQRSIYKLGFINILQFFINCFLRLIAGIIPVTTRKLLYKVLLRKSLI